MRTPDLHIHSHFSPDSLMNPVEAVNVAIEAGITDLCFTEHMDLGHHIESFNRIPDFAEMYASVSNLRKNYSEIRIYNGLEMGYISQTANRTAEIVAQQNFDYVLLSTHCVDGIDCYFPEATQGKEKVRMYKSYLETVRESVYDSSLANCYDCVGHIGYIAKCRHYEDNNMSYQMFPTLFDEILTKIIKDGKGIEVNTSGLKHAGHVLPHPSIIRRYHELGGRIITVGSDAHKTKRVGANISDTIRLIRDCGFEEFTLFEQHKPEFVSIE